MKDTARAAARLGVEVVTGFTGSSIWHLLYSFPPNDFEAVEEGYRDFAERWNPIVDVFDEEGVRFALEVHPTEIAYDFVTTRKALAAIDRREAFGINFDPSHFAHQFLDSAAFVEEFADRIYHVHIKDSIRRLDGRSLRRARPTQTQRHPGQIRPAHLRTPGEAPVPRYQQDVALAVQRHDRLYPGAAPLIHVGHGGVRLTLVQHLGNLGCRVFGGAQPDPGVAPGECGGEACQLPLRDGHGGQPQDPGEALRQDL
jgi:hypothetical protein